MKLTKVIFVFFTVAVIFSASCKKDDDGSKVSVGTNTLSMVSDSSSDIFKIKEVTSLIVGDTTTIIIKASAFNDSLQLVVGFQKINSLSAKKYDITWPPIIMDSTASGVYVASIFGEFPFNYIPIPFGGNVTVLEYTPNKSMQGKIEYQVYDMKDSLFHKVATGEFNVDMDALKPENIKDIDIKPNTIKVNINSKTTEFTAQAGLTNLFDVKKLILTGKSDSSTLTIEYTDLIPVLGKEYLIGEPNEGEPGYINATFVKGNNYYYTNSDLNATGKITVSKMTSTTFQGSFSLTLVQNNNIANKVEFTEGYFFAPLKNYNK